tara:strand:- start:1892 stop:3409 length:1518 start_codon:yes stop_codon:yes gene_type:complete
VFSRSSPQSKILNLTKINKSKYFSWIQCDKKLYFDLNLEKKSRNTRPNNRQQLLNYTFEIFDKKYKNLYPKLTNKIDIISYIKSNNSFYSLDFKLENEELSLHFDAILFENNIIQLFIIKPAIYPKKNYIKELNLQKYLLNKFFDNEIRSHLILINKDYQFTEDLPDLEQYLNFVDCTEKVDSLNLNEIEFNISQINKRILSNSLPNTKIGSHCKSPYQCDYFDNCRTNLPDFHVEQIPNQSKDLKENLLDLNITDIKKLPDLEYFTPLQQRIIKSVKNSKEFVSCELKSIINSFKYPLYFLDFETIISPYKIFAGTKPFEPIPCMWSLHSEKQSKVQIQGMYENKIYYDRYYKFTGEDPRREFIEKLIESVGDSGSIFIYSDFEIRIFKNIAIMFPEYKHKIDLIINRCVDLLKITKNNYYHPKFKGSFSLKSVSKILTKENMYDLEFVNSGDDASRVLIDLITNNINSDQRKQIELDLLKYAEKDTLNLVDLYKHLKSVSEFM